MKAKNNKAMLERAFPKKYIEQGLNASKTYKLLKTGVADTTARTEGAKLLAKPYIKKEIMELLEDVGLNVELAAKIHKRNLQQDKNLSVSQTAVQDMYRVAGIKGFNRDKDSGNTVNIALVVKE